MKILLIGGGGRENSIIRSLAQSPRTTKLYAAPGNAGIAGFAECFDVKATDIEGIIALAKSLAVDCVFVAPDDPLSMGLVDELEAQGVRAFGPYKAAARLESSKVFSKALMRKYGIPTAAHESFDDPDAAIAYIKSKNEYPVVLKADGLALGKGVIIAQDEGEALKAVSDLMLDKAFGNAGNNVVVEEFLSGREVTILAFCDGKTVVPMISSQDHKKVFEGERGLNTGGMGVFAPSRYYTADIAAECEERIFQPTLRALESEGIVFKGVIYFGLMMTAKGVYVIEYNARFGDPEAQGILPLLETDLVDIMDAVIDQKLADIDIKWRGKHSVGVVMASGGYPEKYPTGFPIRGLDDISDPDVFVYHAGTKTAHGEVVTAGGRVLCVTAIADTHEDAIEKAYAAVGKISFEGQHYRKDIGLV